MGSENSSSSPSGTKIGRILEQAREEQGLSLKQVEQATKIRARYLKELEGGNFGVLPAVYVRGSLRTYADHLGLDGEALTRELKHQQAAPEERTTPIYDEPSESDPDRSLVSASSPPVGAEGRTTIEDKEDVSSPSILVGNRFYSYLGSGALVVLILGAVALALILIGKDQWTALQEEAREPMASPATPTDDGKGEDAHHSFRQAGDERSADDEGDGRLLGEQAGQPDRSAEDNGGAGRVGQTRQGQSGPGRAGGSRDATTTSSAPTILAATPATTEPNAAPTIEVAPVTTKPNATQIPSAPTTVESAPVTVNPNATPDPSAPTTIQSAPATANPNATPDPSAPTTAKPAPWRARAAASEPAALPAETTRHLQRTPPTGGPDIDRRALP